MDKKLILTSSLQGHFYEGLLELNKNSLCPMPESLLFYSSNVLDKFALSDSFFEMSDGKVREKILGMKLLEASRLERDDQKKVYKEVADMSLILCGYFPESVNRKLVDTSYYSQIGKMAYGHLNSMSPTFLDIPCFYQMVSTSFENLTNLLALLAKKNQLKSDDVFVLPGLSRMVS